MKTPEQYIKDQFGKANGIVNYSEMLKALKYMQEDHEKELIEFAEYSQKRGWEPSWHHTDDKEKIIQFRNKQQDR